MARTPDFAAAARVSLEARGDTGDSQRSWTWPWRCALWARLGTSNCHRMIDGLIEHNLLPNLITTHPPLQLDGNYGITAGIAEMLLQSHAGELVLLPAVDFGHWANGAFSGLKARGDLEVSARWEAGRLVDASLLTHAPSDVQLRSTPPATRVTDSSGRALSLKSTPAGSVKLKLEASGRYQIHFD